MLGIGCSSHISDNAIHHAIDRMNYDLENFCNKIEAHFSNHALRWESFKRFAEKIWYHAYLSAYAYHAYLSFSVIMLLSIASQIM